MRTVPQQTVAAALALTSNYQAGTAVAPFANAPAGGAWRAVSLWTKYVEDAGAAGGQCRVRIRWVTNDGTIPAAIPAVGFEIDLPTDYEIVVHESYSVVTVEAPGLANTAVVFDFKEVGDAANPGTIEKAFVMGTAL